MKVKELRELNDQKLVDKLDESKKELFNLRFQHATAQLENTQRLGKVKKTIARIMTIQRERELRA